MENHKKIVSPRSYLKLGNYFESKHAINDFFMVILIKNHQGSFVSKN